LAKKVFDEIVSEETEILKELIPRMFEVMHRVAKLSCDYVKRGRWSSPWLDKLLRTAARRIGGPYPEMIEEMERELNEVIEDFDRAVNVEALRLAHETSKLPFSQSVDNGSSEHWRRARASGKRAGGVGGAKASGAKASGARASRARASRARTSRARTSRARTSRARIVV
jgi:hypothetical protein